MIERNERFYLALFAACILVVALLAIASRFIR